jgi:hypothetical protein
LKRRVVAFQVSLARLRQGERLDELVAAVAERGG